MKYSAFALSLSLALSAANPLSTPYPSPRDNSQLPISYPTDPTPGQTSTGITTLEVEGWSIFGIPVYVTPIAVGTPNQVFRVYLHLGISGLLVRSDHCGEGSGLECGYGGDLGFVYNSSASSTYEDAEEEFHFMMPAQNAYGSVGRDDVKLNALGLDNVTIGELKEFYGENYFLLILSDIADGALGLAHPNAEANVPYSEHKTPNILSRLLNDTSLASPIISFSLPPWYVERGSITLGSLPAGYDDVGMVIPFGDLSHGWNVPLTGLIMQPPNSTDKNTTLDTTSLKFVPTFGTSSLIFPPDLLEKVYDELHALPDSGWDDMREFNCSYLGKLPDIIYDFDGAAIPISEADYTLHGFLGEKEVCLLTISRFEEGTPGVEDVVALGAQLFERSHVVFDLTKGEESMGLIERNDKEPEIQAAAGLKAKNERTEAQLSELRKREGKWRRA